MSNKGNLLAAILLLFASFGLVHFFASLLLYFDGADDYLTALGQIWLILELVVSLCVWVGSLTQLGKEDSLFTELGDKIVRRIRYSLKKTKDELQHDHQEIMDTLIPMSDKIEDVSQRTIQTEQRDIQTEKNLGEIRDKVDKLLAVYDPEKIQEKIRNEFNPIESNLVADALEERIEEISVRLQTFGEVVTSNDQASLLEDIGYTYWLLSRIRNKENRLTSALDAFHRLLTFYTKKNHKEDIARLQKFIGIVFAEYIDVRKPEKHGLLALQAFNKTLNHYSPLENSENFTKIMNNIASVYEKLMEYENAEKNFKNAIFAFNQAIAVIESQESPVLYAIIMNNLGATYIKYAQLLPQPFQSLDVIQYCELAIAAFRKALKIRTPENLRIDYATTQNNLGIAYTILSSVLNRRENIQNAIDAYKKALEIRKVEEYPIYYASTQFNLGGLYIELAKYQNRNINCSFAFEALYESLEIYTLEAYPEKHKKAALRLEAARLLCR